MLRYIIASTCLYAVATAAITTTIQQGGISVALVVDVEKASPTAITDQPSETTSNAQESITEEAVPTVDLSQPLAEPTASSLIEPTESATATTASSKFTHSVIVAPDHHLTFAPPFVNANVGDTIELLFRPSNHSFTESSLGSPCDPLPGGFRSGFNQFHAPNTTDVRLAFSVNSPEPRYFFCEQLEPQSHCELGMVFAINPGPSYGPFMSAAIAEGPFSQLVTTAGVLEVTLSAAAGLVTTTLTSAVIPTTVLPMTTVDVPSVFLPSVVGINSELSSLQSSAATAGSLFRRRLRI